MKYDDNLLQLMREIPLKDFCEKMGLRIKQEGKCYSLIEYDSLKIFPDNKFYRFSNGRYGDIFDLMNELYHSDFKTTYQNLKEFYFGEVYEKTLMNRSNHFSSNSNVKKINEVKVNKNMVLPIMNKDQRPLITYLEKRGIPLETIKEFYLAKMIRLDVNNNIVFIGYDQEGKAKFGSLRGTHPKKQFRGNLTGSDKSVNFKWITKEFVEMGNQLKNKKSIEEFNGSPNNIHQLKPLNIYLFESAIDLMSYKAYFDFTQKTTSKALKEIAAFLSLDGFSESGLEKFLESDLFEKIDKSNIKIVLGLDNDEAGEMNSKKIAQKYHEKGYEVSDIANQFKPFKDVNEWIQHEGKSLFENPLTLKEKIAYEKKYIE